MTDSCPPDSLIQSVVTHSRFYRTLYNYVWISFIQKYVNLNLIHFLLNSFVWFSPLLRFWYGKFSGPNGQFTHLNPFRCSFSWRFFVFVIDLVNKFMPRSIICIPNEVMEVYFIFDLDSIRRVSVRKQHLWKALNS